MYAQGENDTWCTDERSPRITVYRPGLLVGAPVGLRRMIRLALTGGILTGATAAWGPLAPALMVVAGCVLLLVVTSSEDRTRRLGNLIRDWRGRPRHRPPRRKPPRPAAGTIVGGPGLTAPSDESRAK